MEKLSGIFDNIKDRISNPLIFSFIVSWIFINWRISVALLWYDSTKASFGSTSLIDYIGSQINTYESFGLPFGFAILYTFSSPIVKNGITAFYTLTNKWGDRWRLNISKGSKIPFEKYLTLHESLIKKALQLQDIIEKENVTAISLQETQNTLLDERQEHRKLLNEYSENKRVVDNLYRSNILDGIWNKSMENENRNPQETQVIQISNNTVYIQRGGGNSDRQYQINHFIFDITQRKIQFILFNVNQNNAGNAYDYWLSDLTYNSNEHLSGWEYRPTGRFEVEYKKPKISLD